MQLIEAVPNISEARDKANLAQIIGDVQAVLGSVRLLHVDSNADANRTVLTLVGSPEHVSRVCFMLFRSCQAHIDMRFHSGAHPRLGAVDVCPLIPISEITLQQTAQVAHILAQYIGEELCIPIYMYEASARTEQRKNLAFIRHGGYESLPQKLHDLPPDYGPEVFSASVASTGASIIGARNFLIAFNISLNTQNITIAKQIASSLREKDGGLPGVKAIGWYMPSYQCVQVSFNITDFHKSNLQDVFEATKQKAASLGVRVTGSELIGMLPQEAILNAGKFYASNASTENELIAAANEHLLLSSIRPFIADKQILEKALAK